MRELINIVESARMRLGDLVSVKVGNPDADFWIERRNTIENVGKPTKEFGPERFGITVTRPDVVDANYLFYMMTHLHNQGVWKGVATGSLKLVGIRAEDIRNIPVG